MADDEWQRPFSRIFYKPLVEMIQIVCCWKDIIETTFSCRTLPLIPNGLRAILKLRKCAHCFFATPKSATVRHPTENRTASDENRTASDRQVNFMISFVERKIFSDEFLLFFYFFCEWEWTAERRQVNHDIYRSEPHIYFCCCAKFLALSCWAQVNNITLKNEPHPRTKRTACVDVVN